MFEYPLALTQGDIENIVEMLATVDPTTLGDVTAFQFASALQLGWSSSLACRTLRLAKDMPGTTNVLEQSHGLSASHMSCHSGQGEQVLQARIMIRQGRFAFNQSLDEMQLHRLLEGLEKQKRLLQKRFGIGELLVSKLSKVLQ